MLIISTICKKSLRFRCYKFCID